MLGLLVKLQTAEEWGVGIGPPLHDCLFVERSGDTRAIADAMSANILAKTGRHVTVAVKRVEAPPEAEDPAVFKLKTQMDFFDEKDFRHNMGMTAEEDIAASLLEYNTWLGRFFRSHRERERSNDRRVVIQTWHRTDVVVDPSEP